MALLLPAAALAQTNTYACVFDGDRIYTGNSTEGGEAEYAKILALFRTRPLNEEKKAALIGLGAAPTPAVEASPVAPMASLAPPLKIQN